ncbi:jg26890 [Pararge aegeria aegeria]|uniref:Jg26890 protein n=1 Tax=Pararge aegeria aegeria TaxID=348720 RepID=A0A8S4SEI1_9NEOP|nr:jg26890 [Pararge aegeria aegeria]
MDGALANKRKNISAVEGNRDYDEALRTVAENHLRGCNSVTREMGRARKIATRRDRLDAIVGKDVDQRVPPSRAWTSARFDVAD